MANTSVQDVNRQWEILSLLICAEEKHNINRANTEVDTMAYFLSSEPIRGILLNWLQNMLVVNGSKTDFDAATKCDDVSLRWRLKGNDKFRDGLIKESYECFSQSVIYAVKGGGPMYSLALANRSAALLKLRRYKECLEDIALAFEFHYPSTLKHKLYLRRSECYIELNQLKNAKVALAAAKEVVSILTLSEAEQEIFESQVQEVTRKIGNLSVYESRLDEVILPLCYLGENDNFDSASNAVELRNSVNAGRCVVAKEPLNRGDILFAEEPYAWVTLCTENPICEMCCSADINPVPCNDCSRSIYCNDKCRSLAAVSFHKWECMGKQSGIFKLIGVGQLALRVLLMSAERGFPEMPEPVEQEFITAADLFYGYQAYDNIQLYRKRIPSFYRMFNLTSNMDKLNNDDYLLYAVTATMIHIYLEYFTSFYDYLPARIPYQLSPSELRVFSAALIFRSMAQLVCNGHTVTSLMTCREHEKQSDAPVNRRTANEQELFRATAVYPSASMMNHSCDANIVSNYYKNRLMVRALREMPAGTEILNCYGPNSARHTTTERKLTLRTQYKFICNCAPCSVNDRRDFASLFNAYACQSCKGPVLWMGSSYRCQQCDAEFNRRAALETIEIAEEIMKRAERTRITGKRLELAHQSFSLKQRVLHRHHKQLRIDADILAKMYTDAGEYTKSAELIRQNIQSHEYQFGSFSVEVAYDLKKLSHVLIEKIHNLSPSYPEFRESVLEAYRVITKAIQLMELNYGSWEPLVKILQTQEGFVALFLDGRTAHASQSYGAHRHIV